MAAHAHPALSLKPLAAAIARQCRWTALALVPSLVFAGPGGEQVVHGTVDVARPDANTTTVTQGSHSAVVNWHSFSVGGQEYVQFVQPDASAAILNRVTGGNASSILGRIDANGRVFLVNPQGVYFGPGAKVDTSAFVASTLDIDDGDFIGGRYVFAKAKGAPDGVIANAGTLEGEQFVALLGDRVANEGLVQARLGTVALAAGAKISLQLDAAGLVNFAVDEATAAAQAGVENTGEIVAHGGRVLMTAKVADDLVATAVNNTGVVRAVGIDEDGGEIFLRGAGGKVVNSGTLDASGANGGRVLVAAADGDVELGDGAVVTAAGTDSGAGGTVRLIAQDSLAVSRGAAVDARGGENGGKGGFVEVSAHRGALELEGDVRAGAGGEVLIDPARLGITGGGGAPSGDSSLATVGKGFIEGLLNANTDVTLIASDEIFASGGPFTVAATGTGALTLGIGNLDLVPSSEFGGSGCSLGACSFVGIPNGSYKVYYGQPTGNINLSGININIRGDFTAAAGSTAGNVALGDIVAANVGINLTNTGLTTGNVTTGAINVGGGNVEIEAGWMTGNVSTGLVTAGTLFINERDGYGVTVGNVQLGGVHATRTIHGHAGIDSGKFLIGANGLTVAAGGSDSAELYLEALGGEIDVTGPISVTGPNSASGTSAYVYGRRINLRGDVNVSGGGYASVSFETDNGDIKVGGNLNVAARDNAYVDLHADAGDISIGGGLNVTGGSEASIDLNAHDGNIIVSGDLSATGKDAEIDLEADGRVTLRNVSANATGGDADVILSGEGGIEIGALDVRAQEKANLEIWNGEDSDYGSGDITFGGPLTITGDEAYGEIWNSWGSVRFNADVRAEGTDPTYGSVLYIYGNSGVSTGQGARLESGQLALGTGGNGTIDVRTKASAILLMDGAPGANSNVSIDNTLYGGFMTLFAYRTDDDHIYYQSGSNSYDELGADYDAFRLRAAGDVYIGGNIAARSMLIDVSGGTLTVADRLLIGDGSLPPEYGDPASLLFLSHAVRPDGKRIGVPQLNGAATFGPNAAFRARYGISLAGGLTLADPDTPYLAFVTDGPLSLGPGVFNAGSTAVDVVAQFTAYTRTAPIHIEESAPYGAFAGSGPVFTNSDHFSRLPGTTLIIGTLGTWSGPHVGNVEIGNYGIVDIGDQNILFGTLGNTIGAGNIRSTGFIGGIMSGGLLERVFATPIVNEFDAEDDGDRKRKDYAGVEEGGGGGEESLIAQRSNTGQVCE